MQLAGSLPAVRFCHSPLRHTDWFRLQSTTVLWLDAAKCPILSCEYHTRGFAREYDKQRHVLTHYKGTVVCPFCPRSGSATERTFERIDLFQRHLTSVHNVERVFPGAQNQSPSFTPSARELLHECQEDSGDCSICCVTFANAQELYEHLDSCVIRFVQDEEPSEHVERSIELEDRPNIGIYRISEAAMMGIEEAIAFNV